VASAARLLWCSARLRAKYALARSIFDCFLVCLRLCSRRFTSDREWALPEDVDLCLGGMLLLPLLPLLLEPGESEQEKGHFQIRRLFLSDFTRFLVFSFRALECPVVSLVQTLVFFFRSRLLGSLFLGLLLCLYFQSI
jgi:hypothetical protein